MYQLLEKELRDLRLFNNRNWIIGSVGYACTGFRQRLENILMAILALLQQIQWHKLRIVATIKKKEKLKKGENE